MNDRLASERSFQNTNVTDQTRSAARKFYSITKRSAEYYRSLLAALAPNADVLEYGCGTGSHAFVIGDLGARVVGIDISDAAIAIAGEIAKKQRALAVRFEVMNAEELHFADASFDLVCGTGILHHLDFSRAFSELARVLRPGGAAVFIEPMGHNPLIRLYRALTPRLRTRDEHPFLWRDFDIARHWFGQVGITPFHMVSLAAVPFRKAKFFSRLVGRLESLDAIIFRSVPYLRRHAWCSVVELRRPNPEGRGLGD